MKKISIIGGTGIIGSALSEQLLKQGHEVNILTRGISKEISGNYKLVHFNFEKNEWPSKTLLESDHIINLAGRSLADKRFTTAFKEEVYNSRVRLTESLVTYLNSNVNKCNLLINGSAVGIYGYNRGEEILDEDADSGLGFMADLCVDWEKAAKAYQGTRLVILRTGVVLDYSKGAYKSFKTPILLGLGSALASGKQWIPWIHIADMVSIIQYIIANENIEGIVNAVSPNSVRNRRLIGSITDSLNKAILLPKVPAFVLRLLLGEFAESVIGGLHVHPNKLIQHNFLFQYPEIDNAIKNLNWRK